MNVWCFECFVKVRIDLSKYQAIYYVLNFLRREHRCLDDKTEELQEIEDITFRKHKLEYNVN